jgi:hypothetical protein
MPVQTGEDKGGKGNIHQPEKAEKQTELIGGGPEEIPLQQHPANGGVHHRAAQGQQETLEAQPLLGVFEEQNWHEGLVSAV